MSSPRPDPRFEHLSAKLLVPLSPYDIGDAVVHHVEWKREAGLDESAVLERLKPGVRAVYATWAVDAEVCNGGFNQFFYNRKPALARAALAGYELLGAHDYADVMRSALAIREAERDRLASFHAAGTLEAFSESYNHTELGAADQAYYALADGIHTVWAQAVRDHPELFDG